MPYKSEKIKIAGTKLDLRVKLSIEQKEAIKILNEQGYSQRKLAEMFQCSKWSVQNVLHPTPHSVQKRRTKEYWSECKRRYRRRKQQLLIDNKISLNNEKNQNRRHSKMERSRN